MIEVYIYERKDIDNFIKNYSFSEKAIKVCGELLENNYIIANDEYNESSAYNRLWNFIKEKDDDFALSDFASLKFKKMVMEVDEDELKEQEEIEKETVEKMEDIDIKIRKLEEEQKKLIKRREELSKKI